MLNTRKIDRDKLYFIGDIHDMHTKCIEFDERPFDNVEDMHQIMVDNWNKTVLKDDTVIIVGDLAFNLKDAEQFLKETNGYKYLVLGNHDKWYKGVLRCENVLGACDIINVHTDKETIVCCHYPLESWEKMHYGSIHVHGHLHKNDKVLEKKNRYNCGCMIWEYTPVKIQDMIDKFGYDEDFYRFNKENKEDTEDRKDT